MFWTLLAAVLLGLAGAAVLGWPALHRQLARQARLAVEEAATRLGGGWSVRDVQVSPPASLVLRGVRWDNPSSGWSAQAPAVRVQVNLPALAQAAAGRQAGGPSPIRRLQASGVVVREPSGPTPLARGDRPSDPSRDTGAGASSPPGLVAEELAARLKGQLAWLVAEGARSLGEWLSVGQEVGWSLDGVWLQEPAATGTGRAWRSRGSVRRLEDGSIGLKALVWVDGLGEARLSGRLQPGQVRADSVEVRGQGLVGRGWLRVSAPARKAGTSLDVQAELAVEPGPAADEPAGALPWPLARLRLSVDGRWADELPPVQVQGVLEGGGPGWQLVQGAQLQATVLWRGQSLQLQAARLQRGQARGLARGSISLEPPYPASLEFQLQRLTPGVDLPWWAPYRVERLDAAGRLEGPWGRWRVEAQLAASPGLLGNVPVGAASARVMADLEAGTLRFEQLQAPVSTGSLVATGEVAWGQAASSHPLTAGAAVRLRAQGRVHNAASLDAGSLAAFLSGRAFPSPQAPSAAAAGDFTGSFEVESGWWRDGGESWRGRLVRLRFDGPDASVALWPEGDGQRVVAEMVNLAGPLWQPWLSGAAGYGRLEGVVRDGQLQGQLVVEDLAWRGTALGTLTVPVRLDGRGLQAAPIVLEGDGVQARAQVEWQWTPAPAGDGRLEVSWRLSDHGPPARLEGRLRWQDGILRLQGAQLSLQGRAVAAAEGALPWPSPTEPEAGLRVALDSFPLELVAERWKLQLPRGGQASGQLELFGSPDAPQLRGQVVLSAAEVEFPGFPGRLQELRARLVAEGQRLLLDGAQAVTAGGGRVVAGGQAIVASLWPVILEPLDVQVDLQEAGLAGTLGPSLELSGRWSGWLRLQSGPPGQGAARLAGSVRVRSGKLVLWRQGLAASLLSGLSRALGQPEPAIPALSPGARPQAGQSPTPDLPLAIAIQVEPPARLEVPPLGGTGALEGALQLSGTLRHPALEGELVVQQARLRYLGRELRLERSRLLFSPSRGLWPAIDATARLTMPSGSTAVVRAWGDTGQAAGVQLASHPAVAADQLARWLLPLGTWQAGAPPAGPELEQALREQLASWATLPVRESLREALGLDELYLQPAGTQPGWRLQVARYLEGARWYVRYGRNLRPERPEQELEVELPLGPGLTLQAGVREGVGARAGLTWEFQF